ncbi:MAG: Cof-type HAD-IIB family hydrolase [Lachnospiraceae bacterium]
MKKILSFDMDNTLVDDRVSKIPASALEAIDRIRDRALIILSTGRDLTLEATRAHLSLLKPDGAVHAGGAMVDLQGRRICRHLFDPALVERIVSFGLARDLCICGLVDDIQYTTRRDKLEPIKDVLTGEKEVVWGDARLLPQRPVMSLGLCGEEWEADLLRQEFPDLRIPTVIPGIWCDITEPQVSKLHGMQILLKELGAGMQDVVAFGDSMNDYELLEAAGFGVAMGNSDERLKKIADHVTTDIDRDGISNAIRYLLDRGIL